MKFVLLPASIATRAPRSRNRLPFTETGCPGRKRGGESSIFTSPIPAFTSPSATVTAPGAIFTGESLIRTAPRPVFTLPSRALDLPGAAFPVPNATSTGENSAGTAPIATFVAHFPVGVPPRTTKPTSSLVTHHLSLSL